MTNELREKLAKVYELVNNGATEGERAAAKKALDRMVDKYNINADDLENLSLKRYIFKYKTMLECNLMYQIMYVFVPDALKKTYRTNYDGSKSVKQIVSELTYMDWITIESSYEYFRRHMKGEWQRLCMPEINRCRKAKTKKERREELEPIFFTKYIIASKLVKESDLVKVSINDMSQKELAARAKLQDLQGGNYKKQLNRGLLLDN